MIILILIAVLLVVLGVIILIGKGDHLIAGYNLAPQEEKAQYHIKRLRGLIGGLLIAIAPMTRFLLGKETLTAVWTFVGVTFVLCIVVVVLANTWAKKKSQ